jgi:hypothetical protein
MRIAIFVDYLIEKDISFDALQELLKVMPTAEIYSLFISEQCMAEISPSRVKHLPLQKLYKWLGNSLQKWRNLCGYAVEAIDFGDYDCLILINRSLADACIVGVDCSVISIRTEWDYSVSEPGKSIISPNHNFIWQNLNAKRAEKRLAISENLAEMEKKFFRVATEVIAPPKVDQEICLSATAGDYFLTEISNLDELELGLNIIEVFNKNLRNLVVVSNKDFFGKFFEFCGPSIEVLVEPEDELLADYIENCRVFVSGHDRKYDKMALQALLKGKPLILSANSPAADLAGKFGELFYNHKIEEIEGALARLLFSEDEYTKAINKKKIADFFAPGFAKSVLKTIHGLKDW